MGEKINIAVAEDHTLVRQGLVALLKQYDRLNVLFDVEDGKKLLSMLRTSKPDIVLLDVGMPVMNGNETLEKIQARYPKIRVMMISMFYDDATILKFIAGGASAYLPKNADIERVVNAIYSVYDKGFYFDDTITRLMAHTLNAKAPAGTSVTQGKPALTRQEIKILKLLCLNKSNKEIARTLCISSRTVEGHRLKISQKTNSRSVLALNNYAIRHNLL